MHMLRLALITVGCLWLAYSLCREIHLGLTTGSVAYGRRRWHCARAAHPLGFWSLIIVFGGMVVALAFAWGTLVAPSLIQSLIILVPG